MVIKFIFSPRTKTIREKNTNKRSAKDDLIEEESVIFEWKWKSAGKKIQFSIWRFLKYQDLKCGGQKKRASGKQTKNQLMSVNSGLAILTQLIASQLSIKIKSPPLSLSCFTIGKGERVFLCHHKQRLYVTVLFTFSDWGMKDISIVCTVRVFKY